MILNFDSYSVTHCQLPRRLLLFVTKCISRTRLCGFIGFITFVLPTSLVNASEYPEPGVFEVLKDESELRVLIYPAGMLSGFGHSHVISTNDIAGRIVIAETPTSCSVELSFPVESFEVDIDALRKEEGEAFEKPVPDKAKRGTRKNMLGEEVLDSSKFSNVTVQSREWSGDLPDIVVKAEFTVRDQVNNVEFPASVNAADNQIIVTGSFAVTHDQLGLNPFSAALGSLRVRDEMEMKFRITFQRVPD